MKKILLIFTVLLHANLFSQRHEVSLNTKLGTATSNFSLLIPTKLTRRAFSNMTNRNDFGIDLDYKYCVLSKLKLYISTGIDVSQSNYYQKIVENGGYHLDNILVKNSRLTVHILGLTKQFSLYSGNILLEIGVDWIERVHFKKIKNYKSDYMSNNEDWIKYKYNLETYYSEKNFAYSNDAGIRYKHIFFNLEYNLHLKAKVANNTYLNFGFNYSRNNIFFYNRRIDVLYFHGGSTTPTASWSDLGFIENTKFGIRDHFLYFNVGLSYKFGKSL